VETSDTSATCVSTHADCPTIAKAYAFAVSKAVLTATPGQVGSQAVSNCISDSDCKVIAGHCDIGLGACWYVGAELDQTTLDQLASLYQKLGCTTATDCSSCQPQPAQSTCDRKPSENLGTCRVP
jgi:hypothetical protein